MDMTLRSLAYHRNGVCGQGFSVATFDWVEDGVKRLMMGVVFGYGDDGIPAGSVYEAPHVAVFDTALVGEGNITFGENSWRGDRFAPTLYRWINEDSRKGV